MITIQKSLYIDVTKLLHEIGIPAHMLGHDYLRYAILIVLEEPQKIRNITKEVYPEIANKYHTSIGSVEKGIRNTIETTWNRVHHECLYEVFGNTIDIRKNKPSNKEFIATIVDRLRIGYM